MSFQDTVDGLLELGSNVYLAKKQAETQEELIRANERNLASDDFQERLFEERQVQASKMSETAGTLLKYGAFAIFGFAALVMIKRGV